jgi:hypothetical protein
MLIRLDPAGGIPVDRQPARLLPERMRDAFSPLMLLPEAVPKWTTTCSGRMRCSERGSHTTRSETRQVPSGNDAHLPPPLQEERQHARWDEQWLARDVGMLSVSCFLLGFGVVYLMRYGKRTARTRTAIADRQHQLPDR